jgi:hypothetical protein
VQIARLANPLMNEVLIGLGSKNAYSQSQPRNDSQFASFFLDPLLARILNAAYGINVPDAPRTDLLPLVQYSGAGTRPGPVADLLRLNLATAGNITSSQNRLGVLGGDPAGFPNGRRLGDDVVDIALRVVAGALAPRVAATGLQFNVFPNNALGDGVFGNERPFQATFPYVAFANSGRDSKGRVNQPANVGSITCVNNPLDPACLGQ